MKRFLFFILLFLDINLACKANRIGFFSSWDIPCGIAMYTRHMAESFRKQNYLTFFYKHTDDYEGIYKTALENEIHFLVIQYEPALILNQKAFKFLINKLKKRGVKIVTLIHDFWRFPKDFIEIVDLAIVHRKRDLNHLNKIKYLPMGVPVTHELEPRDDLRKKYGYSCNDTILVSVGFPLHTKQIDVVLEKMALFLNKNPSVKIQLLHSFTPRAAEACQVEYEKIESVIKRYRLQKQVFLNKKFISQEEFIDRIHLSDLGYQWFSHNSNATSASMKEYICARTPFVIPNSTHFHDSPNVGNIKTDHDLMSFVKEIQNKCFDVNWLNESRHKLEKYYLQMNYDVLIKNYIKLFEKIV